MKKIYTADWHITFKRPRIRTDNYAVTIFEKVKWICNLANEHDADITIAGDIFDKPSCPIVWLYAYIELLKTVKRKVYVIYGQHDLHFHNPDLKKTPLGILLAAGAVIDAKEVMDTCNFGEEIPASSKSTHLCGHIPVTRYEPPFYMEDAISAHDFLQENPEWKTIITGDFHEQHVTELGGRTLFNPGPIMRPSKDKVDFVPKVILHDTVTNEWKWIDIPIKKEVFDYDKMDKDDRTDYKDKFREYAGSIDSGSIKQNFRENIEIVLKKTKSKDGTLKIIDDVMEEINE